mmetsp:Transcript_34046/g.87565  ORF Transcript_34046/g.87565 Transcript_34046/m.87565 type:complete len:153 (-) Transcript_34046:769-1227(-)
MDGRLALRDRRRMVDHFTFVRGEQREDELVAGFQYVLYVSGSVFCTLLTSSKKGVEHRECFQSEGPHASVLTSFSVCCISLSLCNIRCRVLPSLFCGRGSGTEIGTDEGEKRRREIGTHNRLNGVGLMRELKKTSSSTLLVRPPNHLSSTAR